MHFNISLKKIKSLCAFAMCMAAAALSIFTVGAEDGKIEISQLSDMEITLPDNMTAATRQSKNTDRYFSLFGLNYESTMSSFEANDIYLQGMDADSKTTVTVTMTKTSDSESIGTYSRLSEDKLSEVRNNFLTQGEYISCTPDEAQGIVWLLFDVNVTSSGNTIKAYQANTVYNGMSVNITLQHNDGNVDSSDFGTFSGIVSSVTFNNSLLSDNYLLFSLIGAGILVIAVIIILIIVARKAKERSKKSKNDKILQELASKYTTDRSRSNNNSESYDSGAKAEDEEYEDINANYPVYEEAETEDYDDGRVKIYERPSGIDDDEVERIVSETLERRNSGQPTANEDVSEEITDENADGQSAEDKSESFELFFEDGVPDAEGGDSDEAEDFDDDEELLRAEAKGKFADSDDFFEEAPKRVVGIIDSADLKNAEDYDVILEEEKRIKSIEREQKPKNTGAFIAVLAGIGSGIKSFGVHMGYFITNASRMIKRKRAIKKRKKAEAERREKERRRREAQRQRAQQRDENGLVRVHSASDTRRPQPQQRSTPSRRPAQNRAESLNSAPSRRRPVQNKNTVHKKRPDSSNRSKNRR